MNTVTIRKATNQDLPHILDLLSSSMLPTEGVAQHVHHFLVAEMNGKFVGTIGLEVYQNTGLLRSAAVLPDLQNKGIGSRLLSTMLDYAREQGIQQMVLLTTTAQKYFGQKGFIVIDRNAVKGSILSSIDFQGSCPSTAVCMEKIL